MKHYCLKLILAVFLLNFSASYSQSNDFVRVMTYNILNGFDYGKDSIRENKMVDFIKSKNPDVVALQELCGFTEIKLKNMAQKWQHHYVAIVKEDGYPVGITSNKPIKLKNKQVENLWHGMLHIETHGIDFLVVHLSPSDLAFRTKEARWIGQYIQDSLKNQDKYMVLGDFNAHSPFDAELDKKRPMSLELYRANDKNRSTKNLQYNELDYSVLSTFLSYQLVDVCERLVSYNSRFSFPTPILIGTWRKPGEIVPTRKRIDYILVSQELAKSCTKAKIINSGATELLSDHFPVIADFKIGRE